MLAILFLLSTGVAISSVALEYVTLDASFPWLWAPAVLVAVVTGGLLMWRVGGRRTYEPSPKAVAAALEADGGALARITSVSRTKTTLGDAVLCHITFVVDPEDRDAYKTSTRMFVDAGETSDYQPGVVKLVARPDVERPEAWIVRRPDREWRKRIKEERDEVPEDAPVWRAEKDAPPPGRRSWLGEGKQRRPLRVVLYALAFLVGVGAPAGVFRDDLTLGAEGVFSDADPDDFARNWRQQAAVDALTEVTGTDQVAQLVFEHGSVTSAAPTTPGADTLAVFRYENGKAERQPEPIQATPEQVVAALFDVDQVDVSSVPGIVEDAMEATGMAEPTELVVGIARATTENGTMGAIQIQVNLTDEAYQGSYTTDVNGTLVSMSGGAPGSAASQAQGG